jgi:hypothetical protein
METFYCLPKLGGICMDTSSITIKILVRELRGERGRLNWTIPGEMSLNLAISWVEQLGQGSRDLTGHLL